MFIFLSSLFLRAQEEQCHQSGGKLGNFCSLHPTSKKQNKMQLWLQIACFFTIISGTILLTSRVDTKQHSPQIVVEH